jgi:hypothetical protein
MSNQVFKSLVRIIGLAVSGLVVLVLVVGLFAVSTIDYTQPDDSPEGRETMQRLNNLSSGDNMEGGLIEAGWATVNITPESPIHLAGYGPRGPYQVVLDSVYARIVVLENQHTKVVIISLDLLMFPRILKERLEQELSKLGFANDQIYFAATHTHHGFGNWDYSIAGQFAFGTFDEAYMQRLVNTIMSGINEARASKGAAALGFQQVDAHELVVNRLEPLHGAKDPHLRIIHIHKQNGQKGILVSFSGHATNLDADKWELSRDYPGVLVDQLEADKNIDFAMFCAGMVGSHNIDIEIEKGHERIEQVGKKLADKILAQSDQIKVENFSALGSADVEIALGPSQLRITKKLRLRDWVFRAFFGPLHANIKVVRVGEVLLVGMPCDYSGELSVNHDLDAYAAAKGLNLFVTSFNGNYVGYITEDKHYNTCRHDEVRTMNWVGPHMGNYFTGAIKKVIDATAK